MHHRGPKSGRLGSLTPADKAIQQGLKGFNARKARADHVKDCMVTADFVHRASYMDVARRIRITQ